MGFQFVVMFMDSFMDDVTYVRDHSLLFTYECTSDCLKNKNNIKIYIKIVYSRTVRHTWSVPKVSSHI